MQLSQNMIPRQIIKGLPQQKTYRNCMEPLTVNELHAIDSEK